MLRLVSITSARRSTLFVVSTAISLSLGLPNRLVARLESSSSSSVDSYSSHTTSSSQENQEKVHLFTAGLESDFWGRVLNLEAAATNDISQRLPSYSFENMGKQQGKDSPFQSIAVDFMKLLMGGSSSTSESHATERQTNTVMDLIKKIGTQRGVKEEDSFSFEEILHTLDQYKDKIKVVAEKYVSNIDFTKLTPMALAGYVEYEDEKKNASWKRRVHRFCRPVEMDLVEHLHDALEISFLAYADNVDSIVDGLNKLKEPCELIDATIKSIPGEPASFLAVKRNQNVGGLEPLEVIMAIRGTKTFADAITDMLCDTVPYRGGKAHEFIVKSGNSLVNKYTARLEEICKQSGKSKIKLTIIGHSLGAGAASIAGIELNDHKKIDVEVVGFGCPALMSKDLAEKATFVTTVVNDSDCVPRMSAVSIVNLLLRLVEFDWIPYAQRDIKITLEGLQKLQPSIFTKDACIGIQKIAFDFMEKNLRTLVQTDVTNRTQPELFPPGNVVHIYRDGYGYSACFVPNDFFNEIDVTRRMIDDHVFHTGYQQTFLEFMRQYKNDHHFTFDSIQVSD